MAYETKINTGSLFANQHKQKETHPDYTGTINVGGVKYRLSGWKRKSAKGIAYLSLSVQVFEGDPQNREPF